MKLNIKKIIKSKYFIGSLLVTVVYIAFLCIAHITPFGEKSILKTDLFQQYAEFLANFKDILLQKNGLFMSWNMGLGNNFFTTYTYYLVSPFNILVILFKKNDMYIFVELITYLKLLTIYNSATLYLEKAFNYKNRDLCIFGLIYTFSSYVVCYLFHIMWIDAVYMLPIILLFTEKFIKTNKVYPVIIFLAYTILLNYYLGFIVAFFTGSYCIIRSLTVNKLNKKTIIDIFKFILSEVVAVGIAMVFFLPSFMQMKSNMRSDIVLFEFNKEKLALLTNVIFNNYLYDFAQKAGLIFTSTFTILLIPMFYGNKGITKKEKFFSTLLIIFMLLPIVSPILNRLWHGMTSPNMFFYRYAFCLQLLLIVIALRVYQNKEKITKKNMIISLIVFYSLTFTEIALNALGKISADGTQLLYQSIIISMVVYQVMWLILYAKIFTKKEKIKKFLSILIIITIVIDLIISINSYQSSNHDDYFSVSTVKQYDKLMEEFMPEIDNTVTDRVVFNPNIYSNNFSQKYGYSTIGFFTSARNKDTIRNMYNLGYNIQRDEALWLTSYSGTWFNYSLAGVKYYISEKSLEENEIYGLKLMKQIDSKYNIYENELQLPFVNYQKDKVTIEQETNPFESKNKNPFEIQNDILRNLSGKNESYIYPIDEDNKIVKTQKVANGNKILYNVEAMEDTNLYIFGYKGLQLYKQGQPQFEKYANLWSTETGIKHIKHLNIGEKYSFEIEAEDIAYIYATDNTLISNIIREKQKEDYKIEYIGNNEIGIIINAPEEGYANFEIAFDDGWRANVNGEEKSVDKTNGALLGVKVNKGENKIHLYFIPRYFKVGLLVSVFSLIVLILIIALERKREK